MKKIMHWVLAATLICGASVFTACSSNEDNHAMPDGNTPGIAMIVKNGQIDYWRQIETAFRGICQEKGMEAYYYATTSDNAYQEQASAVKELRKLGSEALKAIVFAPCYGVHDESTETEVAALAKERGIPVVILDSPVKADSPLYSCPYFGTDNAAAGKAMAEMVAADEVAVFAMAPGPGIERADAFKVLKPAATVYPIGDNAISEVQSALAEFDDFVFFNGSPLLDVLPMLKAAGKRVYTFDAYGDFLDELIAGSPCLRGVMAQNTFGMTRKAVEAAIANAKQGEMVPTFYINGFNLDDPSVQPFLDFYGKQVPVIEGLSEKVLGKWILSEVEGHPLPTNDKVVFTFAENNQFFLSMSRVDNTDEYLKWDNRIPCQLKKEGNTFTITGSTADGNIEAVMKVLSITDTELLADMDFTIVASDSTHHEKMTQLYTRTPDYTEAILGLWEGRISSEQSVYDDNLDHRWEYKDDGTYLYYRHTSDGQWVADVNLMSVYFVDGCLLCTSWEGNDGAEYREWWEIESIEDGVMKWKALRLNDDGSPFYATFQMTRVDNSLYEMIVGKWIHTDTDGEVVETDMKSVYTFEKNGDALKGFYSMSMTESGVWAYNQETDVTLSDNNVTLTSHLADGVTSVVELSGVTVSGDDLRFTAKTTLSKDGQVTATYGPRQEHFTRAEADYTEAVVGLWEITFTSDYLEYESSEPYRELYRADGTCSFYDLIDGLWVEEETTYCEYFTDDPLFCFRWQKPKQKGRRENWEIVSCGNGEMVSKALHRRTDGSFYTITAHLKKVE